ncbi:MAG: aldose 1-epimerase family protein [Proteobacteria bacterium]|nr:aldose 1-epimerase family protein [Pseudomonadota bacterium]
MQENFFLKSGQSEVELSAAGAEIFAWRVGGRDLLWNGDPAFWPRRAPILFPFCGWLRNGTFRVGGQSYASGVHGFGHTTPFRLERHGPASARMVLDDTPATHAVFPFRFHLTVNVSVGEAGFACDIAVENPGETVLPFALGYHPGFRWPFDGGAREAYRLVFEQDERAEAVRTAPGGLFTGETIPAPLSGRDIDLSRAFAGQDSLVFRNVRSERVAFVAPSGRQIVVTAQGFPNRVFWTRPGAGYLCIEPWTGEGDPVDFSGDLSEKPGMILLPPRQARRFRFACELQ